MAILEILHYPDRRLRTVAEPVDVVNGSIRTLVDDMFETMYAAPGIGLAATQVNVHKRVLVMDLSEDRNEPLCLINPEILSSEGVEQTEEGCLSVPDIFETVERAERISVKALDREGKEFTLDTDGLLAVCIQHEMDHLQGNLFVDYLSPLKQLRLKKKIQKARRQAAII
jgi:peptide deformylase